MCRQFSCFSAKLVRANWRASSADTADPDNARENAKRVGYSLVLNRHNGCRNGTLQSGTIIRLRLMLSTYRLNR
jgi:hypothetical protein